MHALHERLPGYDPGSILHDHCEECEERAADALPGLTALDHNTFRQAWADMLAAKWSGGAGLTRRVSDCDYRLMNALYTVAVLLERAAGQDPRVTLEVIDERCAAANAQLAAMFGPR